MSKEIERAEVPWSDGIIMICTKCARKLGDEEISDRLKKELKGLVKHEKFDKNIRTVTTSCLDICPDDRMTAAYAKNGQIKVVTFEEGTSPEELLQNLIST